MKIVLEDLLNKCESASHSDWIKECNDINTNEISSSKYKYVNPINFLQKISNEFDSAIVTCDVGQHQIWCANTFNIKNGRFFTSGGMGTMGYSLPCAVGCALVDNKTDVICVCGDGGFQMCMNELATAKKYDLNIKIIVLNNNSLGMVKEYQEHNNLTTFGVDMDFSPDFCNIASAYDIPSIRIKDNNFDDVIKNLKSTKGPFVLEVCVDSSFPSRGEI